MIDQPTNNFIQRSITKHGDKFLYSNTIYTSFNELVTITCTVHGDFTVTARTHMRTKSGGCPNCQRRKYTVESFRNWANEIHSNFYDYSLVSTIQGKLPIICPIHGIFYMTADDHIRNGNRCRKCAYARDGIPFTEFRTRAIRCHSDQYSYNSDDYTNMSTKVKFTCKKCNSVHECWPHVHINGRGCTLCYPNISGKGGYTHGYFETNPSEKDLPGMFYVIRMYSKTESFIKIGITKYDVATRYKKMYAYSYDIITATSMTLYEAFCLEQETLSSLTQYKYWPSERFHGWTECLTEDVVKLNML